MATTLVPGLLRSEPGGRQRRPTRHGWRAGEALQLVGILTCRLHALPAQVRNCGQEWRSPDHHDHRHGRQQLPDARGVGGPDVLRPGRGDARRRGVPLPDRRRLGLGHLGADRRRRSRRWPPACWRWGSSRSSGWPSPPPPASSGCTRTWRSCARARRRRPSIPRRRARTSPSSSPTAAPGSSSPRTTPRSPSCAPSGTTCPT